MTSLLFAYLLAGSAPQTSIDAGWIKSSHTAQIGGASLAYQATAGLLPLKNDKGEVQANIYFTAYTKAEQGADRPLTFAWNGGPGGSSILVHMYCMGPRKLLEDPADKKKFSIVDNQQSLLPDTDLVFIDPVGTGFSRAVKADPKSYWGVEGDIKATTEFIRQYLEATGRKKSPVFLAGESYGTFRAAGAARPLLNAGVDLRGLVLLSNAIRFDTLVGRSGSDLVFTSFLPTMTATSAYFKKLKPEWNQQPDKAIAASQAFAASDYLVALAQGDAISKNESQRIAAKLSEFTGLPADYIEKKRLRIDAEEFRFKLLKDQGKTLGKFSALEAADYDPASKAAVSAFVDYLGTELGYKNEEKYLPLNLGSNLAWSWGSAVLGSPDQTDNLRSAMEKYPQLRLLAAQGLYDLTTAFYGAEYSFNHLGLSDAVKDHWEFHTYQGGHMMYLVPSEHVLLKSHISAFMQKCLGAQVVAK